MLHDAHVTELRDNIIGFVWDVYKDAHGFRPRHFDFASMSVAQLEALEASVIKEVHIAIEEDQRYHERSIKRFEARINELIAIGAQTREKAIAWLKDAEDNEFFDEGMFEYETGLPYGYLKREENA